MANRQLTALDPGPGSPVAAPSDVLEQSPASIEGHSWYRILTAPGESTTALHFNLTKRFPSDNKQARQAVATALDRPDMVKRLLLGQGEVGSTGNVARTPCCPPASRPTASTWPRPAPCSTARDQGPNGDGMRELSDAQAFQAELLVATSNVKPAELIKAYLRTVGIDLQVKSADQATHDRGVAGGNYQMALVLRRARRRPRLAPPAPLVEDPVPNVPAVQGSTTPGSTSWRRRSSRTDPAQRLPMVQEMQWILRRRARCALPLRSEPDDGHGQDGVRRLVLHPAGARAPDRILKQARPAPGTQIGF